jgi:hypothetical protein
VNMVTVQFMYLLKTCLMILSSGVGQISCNGLRLVVRAGIEPQNLNRITNFKITTKCQTKN